MSVTDVIEIEYPTRDGRPIGETELHRDLLIDTLGLLTHRYKDQQRVTVSGNLLLFHEKGNPRRYCAPDVFVAFDVPKFLHDNYKIWEEGKAPDVIFEYTSKSTRTEDTEEKFVLYRDVWKVKEYFLFDPRDEYLDPSLQGYRLVDGEYLRIEPSFGRLHSELLGLTIERDGTRLIFRDAVTGEYLPTDKERAMHAQAMFEEVRATGVRAEAETRSEQEACRLADEEIKRLREELAALQQHSPST